MHEMALAANILQIVEATARDHGARQVRTVRLAVGQLAGVEPEALRFAFEVVIRDSIAAGARFEIQTEQGLAWCLQCCETIGLPRLGEACPKCGGYRLQVTGGDEMRVREIEIV